MDYKKITLNSLLGLTIFTAGVCLGGISYKMYTNIELNNKFAYDKINKEEYLKEYKKLKENYNKLDKGVTGVAGLGGIIAGFAAYVLNKKEK